jgi:transcriptional regulator with XRE-family HTH domain
MTDKKRKADQPDGYEDFLGYISHESAMKDQEMEFMESFECEPQDDGDILVNVGERVRAVREKRGLSLLDIAQRTGIAESVLELIETGETDPPLGTIIKLAKALEMKMGYFISGEENKTYTIVRSQDRRVISRHDSTKGEQYGYEFESLAPHKKDRHMEPFLVTLDPAETGEERSTHDGQEFIFVLKGQMEVRLEDEIHILDPGDAIYYDSTVPHLVKCHGDKSTLILAVLYAEK